MKKVPFNIPINIIREADGKNYFVVVPTLPGCFSQGRTIEEAKKNVMEAIEIHVKSDIKKGKK